jgi:hypothetical protein
MIQRSNDPIAYAPQFRTPLSPTAFVGAKKAPQIQA